MNDIKHFLSEILILEIRTEFGHKDPPEFEKYLEYHLGDVLLMTMCSIRRWPSTFHAVSFAYGSLGMWLH